MFVQLHDITQKLTPERLLDKLNATNHKLRKEKSKQDDMKRLRFDNDRLRQEIATFSHKLRALREEQLDGFGHVVEDKMEGFLEMLADSLNPETHHHSTSSSMALNGNVELPPRHYSDNQILSWLHRKKR